MAWFIHPVINRLLTNNNFQQSSKILTVHNKNNYFPKQQLLLRISIKLTDIMKASRPEVPQPLSTMATLPRSLSAILDTKKDRKIVFLVKSKLKGKFNLCMGPVTTVCSN